MREVAQRHRHTDPFFDLKELFDEWTIAALEKDSELRQQRLAALGKLVAAGDTNTILRLSRETRNPYQVIEILSALNISREFLERLWLESFAVAPNSSFTVGLAGLHRWIAGAEAAQEWLAAGLREGRWSDADAAQFLLSWPDEETTWFVARRLGGQVEPSFWEHKSPRWLKSQNSCSFTSCCLSCIMGVRSLP